MKKAKEILRLKFEAGLSYNDKGQRLYERPASLQRSCEWCGGPIPAVPSLRRGKKWCSQACLFAAYRSRKRAAREAALQEKVT